MLTHKVPAVANRDTSVGDETGIPLTPDMKLEQFKFDFSVEIPSLCW